MAKKKYNATFFWHDSNASDDEKILYLESLFGNDGYAMYFKLLERLTRSDYFELKLTNMTRGIIAKRLNVSLEVFNEFISVATDPDVRAFTLEDDGTFYSQGLKNRLQYVLDNRKRDRERKDTGNDTNGDFQPDSNGKTPHFHPENDTFPDGFDAYNKNNKNSTESTESNEHKESNEAKIFGENLSSEIAELPSENVLFSLSRTLLKYNNSQYKKSQKESYSQKLAKELVTEFGENAINRKLEHLEWKLRYDPPNDPGGYLVRSIREGWPPPAGYEEWIDEQRRINARSRSAGGEALSVAELIKLSLNN